MAQSQKKAKQRKTLGDPTKRVNVALRSLNGVGFEFEDLTCAWHMVKALSGEKVPGIAGVVTMIQAQVSTVGWRIDDLLLTAYATTGPCRLAISVKSNFQVSAASLPADFVRLAWEQWRDLDGPFDRAVDGLALVTLGSHREFAPAWREVKNACSGEDTALAMSRIRSNRKQSSIFDSVQRPGNATDEEAIELIRCLHVLSNDLQYEQSDNEAQAIAQCRLLLASGCDAEAQALWRGLINVAKEVRLRCGSITVPEIISRLRGQFGLRHHPDFQHDWNTLFNITTDYKARIETELPSGYVISRTTEKEALQAAVADHPIIMVLGDSGSGKSALVKSVLDGAYPSWNQVWFGPEDLKTALSAARRSSLPLRHELSLVLNATVKLQNVLVIDSAERVEASEFVVIRQLLQAILTDQEIEGAWRVIIVTQTHRWLEDGGIILRGRKAHLVEVETLKSDVVKQALRLSSSLGWLSAHDDTIAALTNPRTLAWVIEAGASLGSTADGLTSHTAIADRLWRYWTKGRADVQALMMRLAQREASFERSFALTDLEPVDMATFEQRPAELPLRLNERANRIEFEHDLAADWARFQFLKQIWTDTPQWAALAHNPLWTNSLRMLGQFLLRQQAETDSAWDVAFRLAGDAKNELAGDILLDALCLDSAAERFLTEHVDLLLDNRAKHFNRLLQRFHHIATVPTGRASGLDATVGLYMEANYRSIVFGRWLPVLRFLIAQRERLAGLVSSALAKVIQTWLTRTPRMLSSTNPVPFRKEMAEIALAMARTMQVEKGQGVMYLERESLLYTAPLAGAADLPIEVGNWALEIAGRREINPGVKRRIEKALLQKAEIHTERLKTDAEYKAKHKEQNQMLSPIGSFCESLPPWPLGASRQVDMDFRTACFKESALQTLMSAQPKQAAEVLLALIIEDQPKRRYISEPSEMGLGLAYFQDAYPTAFWKSPFFSFFYLAPGVAISSLIALVNFCTERWVAADKRNRTGEVLGVTLQLVDGSNKTFTGWRQVFDWPQSNDSICNGNLYCALDALERWLTQRLDAGDDISADIERILREGNSVALVSVLLNIAKYRPSLLKGPLAALMTFPNLFYWDISRVEQVGQSFIDWSWCRSGQAIFDFARDWALAPHRQRRFIDVVVDLLLADGDVARHLQGLLPTWDLPEDPKIALVFKQIFATLDRANYQTITDPETGGKAQRLVYPEALRFEMQSWHDEREESIAYILLPDECEQRLCAGQPLTDDEASRLFSLLLKCNPGVEDDNVDAKFTCHFAVAATLVALGGAWFKQNPEAQKYALEVVCAGVEAVSSTGKEIRKRRIGSLRHELKFVAYAVTHLWLADGGQKWEAAVLLLLTSGDMRATAVVVRVAYTNRQQLGSAWWRLLRAGLFWSGLILLAPHQGDSDVTERTWKVWLARLRRFRLRGMDASVDDLDFKRVALGQERLSFQRRSRAYNADDTIWHLRPVRKGGGSLDDHLLEALFNWLIAGCGTGDYDLDLRLALRIWDYDVTRAKAGKKKEHGEYDLPSQNLGYDILLRLGALTVAAPLGEDRAVWEPVLDHGPAAHYALRHFIQSLFLRLKNGDDPVAFERVWRATAEYGLAADWSQSGLWFYGERLVCRLLGFGNEDVLSRLNPDVALRMKDLYKRWAVVHLAREEECIVSFCNFLISSFGATLRLDGLCWIANMLKEQESSYRWYRKETTDALIGLMTEVLASDVQTLSQHVEARQALVEIVAALAVTNTPASLALQERFRLRLR